MFQPVTLPFWLFALILAFAAATAASRFLFPSVRWFFRRRMERLVARLNTRLQRPIEPFKLMRRRDTIQRLVYDRDVLAAVAEHAKAEGVPEEVAHERAMRYAREIVPAFSASAYFGFATRAARRLARAFYDVRVREEPGAMEGIGRDATVVFVMNHRSNMDYVLVTYLVAERAALSYAVGEWARVWPLRTLIRAMGAYFIRRKSRDALYRKVLARYVAMATAAGVTQAVFPEGGLSLDGRVLPPKLGILSYIVEGFDPKGRDVLFVPVALNYDRVLEDRVMIEAARRGERKFRASLPVMAAFAFRLIWQKITGKFRKFGAAGVAFGAPLSLAGFLAEARAEPVEALGTELMGRVLAAMPVLPVPLVAAELLRAGGAAAEPAIAEAVGRRLSALGLADPADETAEAGIAALELRRLVARENGVVATRAEESETLSFYAASIAHLPAVRLEIAPTSPKPRKPRAKAKAAAESIKSYEKERGASEDKG
jgi:glycerol-3-phosphate O-acyltransferase